MTKSGTGTWGLGRGTCVWDVGRVGWDVGTWGRGDVGTWGRGDVKSTTSICGRLSWHVVCGEKNPCFPKGNKTFPR